MNFITFIPCAWLNLWCSSGQAYEFSQALGLFFYQSQGLHSVIGEQAHDHKTVFFNRQVNCRLDIKQHSAQSLSVGVSITNGQGDMIFPTTTVFKAFVNESGFWQSEHLDSRDETLWLDSFGTTGYVFSNVFYTPDLQHYALAAPTPLPTLFRQQIKFYLPTVRKMSRLEILSPWGNFTCPFQLEAAGPYPLFPQAENNSTRIRLLRTDQLMNERLALIDKARHQILLATYIFSNDDFAGPKIVQHLLEAARRGVKIRLLIDPMRYFSETIVDNPQLLKVMMAAGIQLRTYHPMPAKVDAWNQRLHDKLLIADDEMQIGSSNIDKLSALSYEIELDAIVSGNSVERARRVFYDYWYDVKRVFSPQFVGAQSFAQNHQVYLDLLDVPDFHQAILPTLDWLNTSAFFQTYALHDCTYVAREWNQTSDLVDPYHALLKIFQNAQEEILFINPYLIPEEAMLRAFSRVKTEGITNSEDYRLGGQEGVYGMGFAHFINDLANTGLRLYEMGKENEGEEGHYFVHGRLTLVDKRWFYIGSASFDSLSAFNNTENGLICDLDRRNQEEASFVSAIQDVYARVKDRSSLLIDAKKVKKHLMPCSPDQSYCGLKSILIPFMKDQL